MPVSALSRSIANDRLDAVVSRQRVLDSRRLPDFVPDSFEDMYRHYFPYVVRLVGYFGIDSQNAEDVAQNILAKFFEKRALEDFNPEYTSSHDGVIRSAVFRTFLSGFVKAYVRHYRDRQALQRDREGLSTDQVMFRYADSGEGATWLDLNAPTYTDEHEELQEIELVTSIRARLAAVPPRNDQDRCDLPAFFNAVLEQTYNDGKVDTAALALQFQVSKTTVQNWLKRLRAEVSQVIEAE
jgi:DNA-directed RNA polymerase specialized sigma24 family protein